MDMREDDMKYLSHTIKKKKNKCSNGENHVVVVSEPKIVKIKDASKGEKISEAPEDGICDALPGHFQERSYVLIELMQPVNLGTDKNLHIIHITRSLLAKEKERFKTFFKEKKIKFTWTYSNMLSLDPNLIMHHLSIASGVKLVK
jgi:hypothetical protein